MAQGRGRGRGILAQTVTLDTTSIGQTGRNISQRCSNTPGKDNGFVPDEKIRSWILKELSNSRNGIWVRCLHTKFEESFKSTPPVNLVEKLKSWSDIITTENLAAGGDIIKLSEGVDLHTVDQKAAGGDNGQMIPSPSPIANNRNPKLNPSSKPMRIPLPKEFEKFDVHVLWVESPGKFCIIPLELKATLDKMTNEMNAYYNSNSQTGDIELSHSEWKPGELRAVCIAGTWYRGVVIDREQGHTIKVSLPDCCHTTCIPVGETRRLEPQFHTLPYCSMTACLHGVAPHGSDSWSHDAVEKFKLIADSREFVCLVMGTSDDIISAKLIDTSGEDDIVVDEILEDLSLIRRV